MHTEILTADQVTVLGGLKAIPTAHEFYLAGGTALGLRHGHRRSIDFDFFRQDEFDGQALLSSLEGLPGPLERLPSGPQTVHVRIAGVSASFFRLPYPLIAPVEPTPWGFGLAADADIAAMKLEAIAGRGARKDFVDLRLLCERGVTLEEVFAFFEQKYGVRRTEFYARLRALSYFEDAERQPMPDMTIACDWAEVKSFFSREAERLLAKGMAGP
jgi:hypothetical protein